MKRTASHAGSWYSASASKLGAELDQWLQAAAADATAPKAEGDAPARHYSHAGYSYSGPTAAYAYRWIDPGRYHRVFIFGPSHHYYLAGCALTQCDTYATPLGDLTVDRAVVEELYRTGKFEWMSRDADEDEHSIEMHLPYVYKALEGRGAPYTIVPILVGALNDTAEAAYGQLLAPYLADPSNFFVISSDFCHWGGRFSYRKVDSNYPVIADGIEALDREGMTLIEALDAKGFAAYLKRTGNTICGRHPISVLLQAITHLQRTNAPLNFRLCFTRYAQSSRATKPTDSSVSYASAILQVGSRP